MAYQSEIEKLQRRYDEKPEQWFAALADAYRKASELDVALEIVRSGIAERPNYVSGHIVLGRCLVDQGNDEEAGNVFAHVLQLDAENIIALKVLGEVAERAGDSAGAREWLERLLEVDPMNDEARAARERLEAETAAVAEQAADSVAPVSEVIQETGEAGQVESGTVESDVVGESVEVNQAESEHPSQRPTPEQAEPERQDLEPAEFVAPPDGAAAPLHGLEPTSFESPVDELDDSTPVAAESIAPEPTDPQVPISDPFRPRDITPPTDEDFVIVRQSDPFDAADPAIGEDKPAGDDPPASTTADPGEDDASNLWATLGAEPELETIPDAESIAARVAAAAEQARPAEPELEEALEPVGLGSEPDPTEEHATGLDLDETTDEMPAITVDALSDLERADAEARDYSEAATESDAPQKASDDVQDQVSSESYQEVQEPAPVDDIEPPAEVEFVPVADSLPEYHVDAPPPRPAGSALPEASVPPLETEPASQEDYAPPETEPVAAPTPDTLSEQTEDTVSEVVEDSWSPDSFAQPPGEVAQEAERVASAEPGPDVTPTTSEAPSYAEPSSVPDPVPSDAPALAETGAPPWDGDDQAVSEVASEDEDGRIGAPDVAEAATAPEATPEPERPPQLQDPGVEDGQEVAPLHEVTSDVEEGTAVGTSDADVVMTETMAEVYAAQGLTHQAREVYQALLVSDPGNATLEAGLAALDESGTIKVADTVPEVAPSYAAALTGGTNVKAFLADVLAARPHRLDSHPEPAGGPDDDLDAPTAMDTAFAEDEGEDAQAATARPADDEMSLAAVFGDEAPQGVPRDIDAAPVDSGDGSTSDMSFDQFFGTAAPSTDTVDESPAAPDESPPAELGSPPDEEDAGEDNDEDFKAWLKSLKS